MHYLGKQTAKTSPMANAHIHQKMRTNHDPATTPFIRLTAKSMLRIPSLSQRAPPCVTNSWQPPMSLEKSQAFRCVCDLSMLLRFQHDLLFS